MRKICLTIIALCTFINVIQSQENKTESDTSGLSKKEARRMAKLESMAIYPLIKSSKWSGVIPVEGITENIDTKMHYKLLFSVTIGAKDSSKAKKINSGLTEVGRVINLHIANGVPLENLEVVVAVHGPSLFAMQNNDSYKKMYKIDNPNIVLINELKAAGVKFVACGQAMAFLNLTMDKMVEGMKLALTAQTIISSHQLKGFVLFNEDTED